jgi:cell division protein FtsB
MFRLIRLLISLVVLAMMIWFATNVMLGKRTLWGHLQAIFATQAAKDLADGTKEEAEKVAKRVRAELRTDGGAARPHAPLEGVDERDRRELDKLVKEKTQKPERR